MFEQVSLLWGEDSFGPMPKCGIVDLEEDGFLIF